MIACIVHWDRAAWAYKFEDAMAKVQKWHTFGMKAYNCTRLLIVDVDVSEPAWSDAEMTVTNHATLNDALGIYPAANRVYVEHNPTWGVDLRNFTHPAEDVVYIFGYDYDPTKLAPPQLTPGTFSVEIEQPAALGYMWVGQCIPIVLRDRYVKGL